MGHGHNHDIDDETALRFERDDMRAEALANFLETSIEDVSEAVCGEDTYEAEGGEYRVLTDSEADEACAEDIRELLWAFNPEFLCGYIADGALRSEDIQGIIGDRCEDVNPIMLALVGDSLDQLVEDAIGADGRGHFLSRYDSEEHESGEFYIYRTN